MNPMTAYDYLVLFTIGVLSTWATASALAAEWFVGAALAISALSLAMSFVMDRRHRLIAQRWRELDAKCQTTLEQARHFLAEGRALRDAAVEACAKGGADKGGAS